MSQRDKASLLAEVVQHVKELKRHAADTASGGSSGKWALLPTETDEVTLDSDPRSSLMRVSICCEDRPGLLSDLNAALRSLRLRAVRAEIATLGGRTKSIFLIDRGRVGGKGEYDEEYQRVAIRRALKAVLDKPALPPPPPPPVTVPAAPAASPPSFSSSSSTSSPAMLLLGNKRARLAETWNDEHRSRPFPEM